jgi:hypothetical protein
MAGDSNLIAAVSDHIESHVGPIAAVFDEMSSPDVHVDVYHVEPAWDRPFHTLVTSGMAERPMSTPPELREHRFAELVTLLDPSWEVSLEAFADPANYWPVRTMKGLACYPHQHRTWLGYGHTVPTGTDGGTVGDGVPYSGVILLSPMSLPDQFSRLPLASGDVVHFYALVHLLPDELQLKIESGTEALLRRLDEAQLTEVIVPSRRSLARRRWFR